MAATQATIEKFISDIAPILQREAKARGYKIVSPAIAQALQESLSSKSKSGISQLAERYHNYHGMKCGKYWLSKGRPSVSLKTGEEYKPGVITQITDYFRVYQSMEEGVKGYYEFLSMKRYDSVKYTKTPEGYMNEIKKAGYCTSSTYIENCLKKIDKYNLRQYDEEMAAGETKKKEEEKQGGNVHIVAKGDTLTKIAKRYDTTVGAIVANNRAKYPKMTANYIVVGWKLKV